MTRFTFDPSQSTILLRTRAKGFLSKLAHDLELRVERASGSGEREGEAWKGRLVVPVDAIRVVGAIKKGKPDPSALAGWEVEQIEKRLREEVFGGAREVVVAASGKQSRGDVEIAVGARAQKGLVLVDFREAGASLELRAKGDVSLKALGIAEVKAPLGAFTVADAIEWEANAVFVPEGGVAS